MLILDRAAVLEFASGSITSRKLFYRTDISYGLSSSILENYIYDDYWIFICSDKNQYKVYKASLGMTAFMLNSLKKLNLDPFVDNYQDITKYYQL